MRIALLHYSAPPVVGGVESVLGYQARLIARAGHAVRIIAGRGGEATDGIEVIQIPLADSRSDEVLRVKKRLDRGEIPGEFSGLVARLVAALSEALRGVDQVIAHNVCSLNKNLALTAALYEISQRVQHPRLIAWHHDLAWTTPRYRAELHDGFPWDLLRTAWPGVTQVTISEFRRRELAALMGIPESQVRVIPNGVDAKRFLKLEDQTQQLADQLHLAEACPLLLLPVRITTRKNIELALRVTAELRRHFPAVKLVVTGPLGPHNPANREYFDKLLALREELGLRDAVHFLAELSDEYLPDEVISDFYRLADALFLPSREEGFGIPVLEAGLAGIPVFCADIAPLRELGEGYADFFPLDEEPAAIARRVIERLESSRAFGLRQRVRSSYTWDEVFENKISPLLREG